MGTWAGGAAVGQGAPGRPVSLGDRSPANLLAVQRLSGNSSVVVFEVTTDRTLTGLMNQTNPDISGIAHPARLRVQTETVRDGETTGACA